MTEPTDEQLNVALCEWLRWNPNGEHWQDFNGIWTSRDTLPDHIHGIEALGHVHEAEKRLTADQWNLYSCHVEAIARREMKDWFPRWRELNPSFVIDVCLIHLTAKQRVIAILRVVRPEVFNQ